MSNAAQYVENLAQFATEHNEHVRVEIERADDRVVLTVIETSFLGGFVMLYAYKSTVTGRWNLLDGTESSGLPSKTKRLRTRREMSWAVRCACRAYRF